MLLLGDSSTSYSALAVMKGTSLNSASFGLIGPEYDLFGTNVTCPSLLNALSFHGPSTMLHSGEPTYVLKSFA